MTYQMDSQGVRLCGTPNCTLADKHQAPHSCDSIEQDMHSANNNFQLGIGAARRFMQYQIGVSFIANTQNLYGSWTDTSGKYYNSEHVIDGVSFHERNVIEATSIDIRTGKKIPGIYPSNLMLVTMTKVIWNSLPQHEIDAWETELAGTKHINSINRAYAIMEQYLKTHVSSADHIVLILDGNGENRRGMHTALKDHGVARVDWPRILTFEVDEDVTLANQMIWGAENVRYCGESYVPRANLLGGNKTKIEHLIQRANATLTLDEKQNVVVLYLDYCGGPVGNQDPVKCHENMKKNVFPHLPNLGVFAGTMSYRRHAGLRQTQPGALDGIAVYMPPPDGFVKVADFKENPGVLCQLFSKSPTLCPATTDLLSTLEMTPVDNLRKRQYLCSVCGQLKKGHVCNGKKLVSAPDSITTLAVVEKEDVAMDEEVKQGSGTPSSRVNLAWQTRKRTRTVSESNFSDTTTDTATTDTVSDIELEAMEMIHAEEIKVAAAYKRLRAEKLTELILELSDVNPSGADLVNCSNDATVFAKKHMPVDTTGVLQTKVTNLQVLKQQMLTLCTSIEDAELYLLQEIDRLHDRNDDRN